MRPSPISRMGTSVEDGWRESSRTPGPDQPGPLSGGQRVVDHAARPSPRSRHMTAQTRGGRIVHRTVETQHQI
jgi:hypothetical protein